MDTAGLNLGVWIDGWVASGSHAIHPRRPSKYRLSPDCASLRLSASIWPLLFAQSKAPTLPCIHRLESPTQEYTALFFTRPSSRILSRSSSRHNGIHRLKRAHLPCATSARTSSVIVEIRSGSPSHLYSSNPCPRISRTLIPRAYRRITCASEPGKRRCDISQYAQAQKWKAGRVESPGAHHPQAGSRSSRCCRCGGYPSVLAHSVEQDDDSVQPPASAPPTVSSVNPKARIRLTATLHLCSVLERAMGLSVHLKIFCLDIFVRCVLLHFDHEHSFFESSSHDLDMQNS